MKAIYNLLKLAIGCIIGVFIGMSLYTCWDYHAHPGLYASQSAPWYLGIQIHAVFTVVICAVLLVVLWGIKRKSK